MLFFSINAKRVDGCEVTDVFFWQNAPKFSRPLLVVGTDSPPKSGKSNLQIWDTRNGRGTRVFSAQLGSDELEVSFGRGIGNAVSGDGTPILFVGVSTGEICGYEINKRSQLESTCILKGLISPVQCVSGDSTGMATVAASDENGCVATWMHSEGSWACIYKYNDENDYCSALGLKKTFLVTGHSSGQVLIHDIIRRQKLVQIVTNAKAVTCIDIHPKLNVALIGGEDCRATVIKLPDEEGGDVQIMLSVCQNGAILGGQFTCSRPDRPDITLLLWERSYLVKYEYDDP